jgi:PKD repeat protein
MEYSGLLSANALDQTNSASGTSTAAVTGTTATTTQANELWLGGIAIADGRRTLNSPYGNGFLAVTNAKSGTASSDSMVYALENITNATGAASSSGTVSASDSWAGAIATFKALAMAVPTLTGPAAGNYKVANLTGSVTITPKSLAVGGLTASNKVYNATTNVTVAGTAALLATEAPGSGGTGDGKPYTGDTVSVTGTANGYFLDKNVGTNKPVNLSGLALAGSGSTNYTLSLGSLAATISPLPITVAAVMASKTYDGTTTAAGTPTITPSLATGDTTNSLFQVFQDPNAGTTNKVLVPSVSINDGNGGANYALTFQNFLNGTIAKASQTINFGALSSRTVGDAPFGLTATASSGLPVGYSSSDTNVATISGTNITIVADGSTTITASQTGNTNYNAATPVAQPLTVVSAAPTAGFTASPTNGYAPLRVVFTDLSSGSITNRHWAFGDGNVFDAASQTLVTNLYANPGVYPVSLIVSGAGGAATNLQTGYINVAAVPAPSLVVGNEFILSPTGAVSVTFTGLTGVRYRMVLKDNLQATNWTTVTPPLPDGWTNGSDAAINLTDPTSGGASQRFYRLEAKSISAP